MAEYPRIDLTVDVVVFGKEPEKGTSVLLIQRKHDPFKGCWAIPGGFVDHNEDLEDAARRELKEETSIEVGELQQLYAFGDPHRDPRKHIVSIAHFCIVNKQDVSPKAADDASNVQWFKIDQLPPLAFDHDQILAMAISKITTKN